jgi:hypothetical protein
VPNIGQAVGSANQSAISVVLQGLSTGQSFTAAQATLCRRPRFRRLEEKGAHKKESERFGGVAGLPYIGMSSCEGRFTTPRRPQTGRSWNRHDETANTRLHSSFQLVRIGLHTAQEVSRPGMLAGG